MPQSPKLDLRQFRLRDRYLRDYPNTIYALGEWRRYDKGVWIPVHEYAIKRELQECLSTQRQVAIKVDNSLVNSVYALVKTYTHVSSDKFDANEHLIALDDCTLNYVTGERRGHLPENYCTAKLPFIYDPNAWSQVWHDSLESLGEAKFFLQEFAGYAVTTSTRWETAVWLHGPPGGGKSTFIAGLEAMLGPRCGLLGLSDIETSSFGLTNLPGKTLVISTEQPAHFIKSAHIINALISGEGVTINRKYHDPVSLQPHCKILWAMNDLPRVDDRGAGLFRRVKLVHFPAIEEKKRDPRVKEEIKKSGMAILNWALAGLSRLNDRGAFDIPTSIANATEHYKIQNDVSLTFIEECCTRDPQSRIQAKALYEEYFEWCKQTNHHAVSSTRFSTEMDRLGFKKVKVGNVYYLGLKLEG